DCRFAAPPFFGLIGFAPGLGARVLPSVALVGVAPFLLAPFGSAFAAGLAFAGLAFSAGFAFAAGLALAGFAGARPTGVVPLPVVAAPLAPATASRIEAKSPL